MRICVCLHLYYINMISEIVHYLNNIDEYDIYITVPYDLKIKEGYIRKHFKNPHIIFTDNIGYDIYPFICFLNTINLENYDIIFKLHTKRNLVDEFALNGFCLSGTKWRYYLFNSILADKKRVEKIIRLFKKNDKVGMIGSAELLVKGKNVENDIDKNEVIKNMDLMGLNICNIEFIAGTMFVVRSQILKPLKKMYYKKDDFPPYYPKEINSLPFRLERCLGCMVSSQGYVIKGLYSKDTLKDRKFLFGLARKKLKIYMSKIKNIIRKIGGVLGRKLKILILPFKTIYYIKKYGFKQTKMVIKDYLRKQ